MRELLNFSLKNLQQNRITPACAGITHYALFRAFEGLDHPRVCGNYHAKSIGDDIHTGSPPRVRELLVEIRQADKFERITPACAGITKRA